MGSTYESKLLISLALLLFAIMTTAMMLSYIYYIQPESIQKQYGAYYVVIGFIFGIGALVTWLWYFDNKIE